MRIFITTLLILIGAAVGGYFLLTAIMPEPIVLNPETEDKLRAEIAKLLPEDEEYFDSLLANVASGGPPKDGIPSIDEPKYIGAAEADEWLLPRDVVFGIEKDGFIAAYPQRILVWHEIVNEQKNDNQFSVTYCPLTCTAIGFEGELPAELPAEFGVSGKLVNSNLIMYDRTTDSYWPQMLGRAIEGPAKGAHLEEFPVIWTTWEKWKDKHPDTLVLSVDTGFNRNYGEGGDPYGSYLSDNRGYYDSDRLLFRPANEDTRLPPKEVVVGIRDEIGNSAAILKDVLRRDKNVEVVLGEETVVVEYDEELDFYNASFKENGEFINAYDACWFAWFGYYPDTQLIQ